MQLSQPIARPPYKGAVRSLADSLVAVREVGEGGTTAQCASIEERHACGPSRVCLGACIKKGSPYKKECIDFRRLFRPFLYAPGNGLEINESMASVLSVRNVAISDIRYAHNVLSVESQVESRSICFKKWQTRGVHVSPRWTYSTHS